MNRDRPYISATIWGLVLALVIGLVVQYAVFVLLGILFGPDEAEGIRTADYFVNGIFFAGVLAPINVILGVALGLAYAATGRPVSRRRAISLGLVIGLLALAGSTAWLSGGALFSDLAGDTFFFYVNLLFTIIPTCILVALAIRWRVPILPPLEE